MLIACLPGTATAAKVLVTLPGPMGLGAFRGRRRLGGGGGGWTGCLAAGRQGHSCLGAGGECFRCAIYKGAGRDGCDVGGVFAYGRRLALVYIAGLAVIVLDLFHAATTEAVPAEAGAFY